MDGREVCAPARVRISVEDTGEGLPAELACAKPTEETALRQYTMLYVEDNPANLMLVEDLIARRSDIRLLSAVDGISGVEMALSTRPDIILMDINLPGINGFRVPRRQSGQRVLNCALTNIRRGQRTK